MSIFSRSSHIKSLGLYSEAEGLDLESDLLVDFEAEEQLLTTKVSSQETEAVNTVSRREVASSKVSDHINDGPKSWSEFKSEFSNVLRMSEDKVESDQFRDWEVEPVADLRRDIFIEMITALHDSRTSSIDSGEETGLPGEGVAELSPTEEGVFSKLTTSQSSPTRPRRQLLSLSTLETIHEAEIDRMLEAVENADPEELLHVGTESSLTDSDAAASRSSPQKLVWGMKESPGSSNEELMEQLEQLSLAQSNGHAGFGDSMLSSGSTSNVASRPGKLLPRVRHTTGNPAYNTLVCISLKDRDCQVTLVTTRGCEYCP